jgi:hypothetical protein
MPLEFASYSNVTGSISNMSLWVHFMLEKACNEVGSNMYGVKKKPLVSTYIKRQANSGAEMTYILSDYKVNNSRIYGDFEVRIFDRDYQFVCYMTDEVLRMFYEESISINPPDYAQDNRYKVFVSQNSFLTIEGNDENDYIATVNIRVEDMFVSSHPYLQRFFGPTSGTPFGN